MEMLPGGGNLAWSEASAHCHEQGKELCSELQWQRACEMDGAIGRLESWTLTAEPMGIAVRGGADGCTVRAIQPTDRRSPNRFGVCCDRAIGVSGGEKSDDWRVKATNQVLQFEAATNGPAIETLGKVLADRVSWHGTELDRSAVLTQLAEQRKADPGLMTLYDRCNFRMTTEGPTAMLIADCSVTQRQLGVTSNSVQRMAFIGTAGPLAYLGDPKGMPHQERKERVKAFLSSD